MDTLMEIIKKERDEDLEIKQEEVHLELVKEETPDEIHDDSLVNLKDKTSIQFDEECERSELLLPVKDGYKCQEWFDPTDPEEDPLALPEVKQEDNVQCMEEGNGNDRPTFIENLDAMYSCDTKLTQDSGNIFINHTLIQRADNFYKCSECDHSFKHQQTLKQHMLKHSGDKPYKCTECSYAFVRSDEFKRHMLRHKGEKPFKCSQCSYSTIFSHNLKTHMVRHMGE